MSGGQVVTSKVMEHKADFEILPQLCDSLCQGRGCPYYF